MALGYILAAVIGFLIALLKSQYTASKADQKVADTEAQINQEKGDLSVKQKEADDAVKSYEDSLKQLDPDFHKRDDGTNH